MSKPPPDTRPAAAEWADPQTLVPWAGNPRLSADAVGPVADSIQRFGFGAPIVARLATREVIAGHTRLAAALALGLAEVPVRFLDVDEKGARALALADNRLGELASWDNDKLGAVLRELAEGDYDLAGLGFAESELAALLDTVGAADVNWKPVPEVIEPAAAPVEDEVPDAAGRKIEVEVTCPHCGGVFRP